MKFELHGKFRPSSVISRSFSVVFVLSRPSGGEFRQFWGFAALWWRKSELLRARARVELDRRFSVIFGENRGCVTCSRDNVAIFGSPEVRPTPTLTVGTSGNDLMNTSCTPLLGVDHRTSGNFLMNARWCPIWIWSPDVWKFVLMNSRWCYRCWNDAQTFLMNARWTLTFWKRPMRTFCRPNDFWLDFVSFEGHHKSFCLVFGVLLSSDLFRVTILFVPNRSEPGSWV